MLVMGWLRKKLCKKPLTCGHFLSNVFFVLRNDTYDGLFKHVEVYLKEAMVDRDTLVIVGTGMQT